MVYIPPHLCCQPSRHVSSYQLNEVNRSMYQFYYVICFHCASSQWIVNVDHQHLPPLSIACIIPAYGGIGCTKMITVICFYCILLTFHVKKKSDTMLLLISYTSNFHTFYISECTECMLLSPKPATSLHKLLSFVIPVLSLQWLSLEQLICFIFSQLIFL